jgi:hypothetical protein
MMVVGEEEKSQGELENTIVKQAFAIVNINRAVFPAFSVLYGCLCVFSYVCCRCIL